MKKVGIVFLLGCMMLVVSAYSQDPVYFEDFDDGMGTWWVGFQAGEAEGTSSIDNAGVLSGDNSLMIEITTGGTANWHVQALNNDVVMENGKTYDLYFMALSDVPISIDVMFKKTDSPYTQYTNFPAVAIGGDKVHFGPYSWACNQNDASYAVDWALGRYDNVIVFLDSVAVVEHVDTAVEGCCPDQIAAMPSTCTMAQNYPNPFNPSTTIPYELSAPADVSLGVYNLNGQLVQTLVQNTQGAGTYLATWDGTDMTGQAVSSGIYICRLDVKGNAVHYSNSLKMFLMK